MTVAELPGPGLNVEQWTHLEALAVSLSPQQMIWVSGLLAPGVPVKPADMREYKLRRLKDEQDLLVVIVESREAPALPRLRFSVLALGDSTYERYCEAGRRLDRRLEELGAIRLHPRTDGDVDDEEPAAAWTAAVLSSYAPEPFAGAGRATAAVHAEPRPFQGLRLGAAVAFNKRHPLSVHLFREPRHVPTAQPPLPL